MKKQGSLAQSLRLVTSVLRILTSVLVIFSKAEANLAFVTLLCSCKNMQQKIRYRFHLLPADSK